MKTEEEARECWCPFARVQSNAKACFTTQEHEGARCIASDCMAFRWAPDATRRLGNGLIAVVDADDAELLEGAWWDGRYPKTANGYLHRAIVMRAFGEIPQEMMVDHIDGDSLNNRRGNLRIVTAKQNAANSASRGGKSKYRGVYRQRSGRWASQISSSGICLHLGTWDTEEEAATAYDKAAEEVHGEFARLNLSPKENSGRKGYCGLAGMFHVKQ